MKNKNYLILTAFIAFFFIPVLVLSQYSTLNGHSHNDYENSVPFRLAYNNHFGSIEADIWAIEGDLYVAHDRQGIRSERTLDALYIKPVVNLVRQNKGKPWSDNPSTFQLLIDIKTEAVPALSLLVEKIKEYPDVFDQSVNRNAVKIVISGNRPDPRDFKDYPDFISFDGLLNADYPDAALNRVPLFSENLRRFTAWNGEGEMPEKERTRIQNVTDSVHAINKKIRFWNAPDDINAWETFIKIGVDYINTDHIEKLAEYLKRRK